MNIDFAAGKNNYTLIILAALNSLIIHLQACVLWFTYSHNKYTFSLLSFIAYFVYPALHCGKCLVACLIKFSTFSCTIFNLHLWIYLDGWNKNTYINISSFSTSHTHTHTNNYHPSALRTFPRGAALSRNLPCCAAASGSCAKYGLPALSPVFPSARAGWRQCGQAWVPTGEADRRKWSIMQHRQTGDTTMVTSVSVSICI